jgi:hypothetical protein
LGTVGSGGASGGRLPSNPPPPRTRIDHVVSKSGAPPSVVFVSRMI